jgi:hypothetical protein
MLFGCNDTKTFFCIHPQGGDSPEFQVL